MFAADGRRGSGGRAACACGLTGGWVIMGGMKTSRGKDAKVRRALVERLWAEGVSAREIARRVGWSTRSNPSNYISAYRAKGWDLPHRRSPEHVKAFGRARWGKGKRKPARKLGAA